MTRRITITRTASASQGQAGANDASVARSKAKLDQKSVCDCSSLGIGPKERGAGLASAIALMGLVAVAAAVFSTRADNTLEELSLAERAIVLDNVRAFAKYATDCRRTMAGLPAPCPAGTTFALRDASGTAHAPLTTYATGSSYQLRGVCIANVGIGRRFRVQYSENPGVWAELFPGDKDMECAPYLYYP